MPAVSHICDEIRELRLEEMHPVLCDQTSSALGGEFEELGSLKWVKRGNGPFRAIFAWQKAPLQGLIPRWGWSIDFVPHIGSKHIGWHKSSRSARIDCGNWNNVRPCPYAGISYISDMRTFVERCGSMANCEQAADDAKAYWNTYTGIEGVLRYTAEFRDRGWLAPLVGHPVPEAFCLANSGQSSLARERLDEESFELLRFHKPFDRARILSELREALDQQIAANC